MSEPSAPPRALAVLSMLLLLTGLTLLGTAVARLPALAPLWPSGGAGKAIPLAEGGGSPALEQIEPAIGPDPADGSAPATAPPAPPEPDAGADDPATLAALEAMSAELERYRAALAERERHLTLREAVMASVEARIGEQLTRLETLKGEIERLSAEQDAEEQARIAQLVKVYEAMKAKSAAAIFDPMALELLLPIVRGMRETKVAAIVAEMDPGKARALTAELARTGGAAAAP